jgi:hypothetical protein
MTEDQVRNVLARVVPDPPDTVTDPAPVVRRARQRRRATVAAATGLAAVLVLGTVLVLRAVGDEPDLVFDEPRTEIADPYATAPCPAPSRSEDVDHLEDLEPVLDRLQAVRLCPLLREEGPLPAVPPDVLVSDLPAFTAALRDLPDAEPGRCPNGPLFTSDVHLVLTLDDGTSHSVATSSCADVEVEGRRVAGYPVTLAFLEALGDQREAHTYEPPSVSAAPLACRNGGTYTPSRPGRETLTEALVCPPGHGAEGVTPGGAGLAELRRAWDGATSEPGAPPAYDDPCSDASVPGSLVLARTDRGDVVMIFESIPCDVLLYEPINGMIQPYFRLLDVNAEGLVE